MTQITERLKLISAFVEKNRDQLFLDLVDVEEDFDFRGEEFPKTLNELKKLVAKQEPTNDPE